MEINDYIAQTENLVRNYDEAKKSICLRLKDIDEKDYLADRPYTRCGEFAATYHILLPESDSTYLSSVPVNYNLMEMWQVTPEELHRVAMENTLDIYPPTLVRLSDMIDSYIGSSETETMTDLLQTHTGIGDGEILLLSNGVHLYGASYIVNDGIMERIGDKIGSDYFVLPSSVHEVIIVPNDGTLPVDAARSMVYDINRSIVEPVDRLSDKVHYYVCRLKQLVSLDAHRPELAKTKVEKRPGLVPEKKMKRSGPRL